jgi:hypothetical protein
MGPMLSLIVDQVILFSLCAVDSTACLDMSKNPIMLRNMPTVL